MVGASSLFYLKTSVLYCGLFQHLLFPLIFAAFQLHLHILYSFVGYLFMCLFHYCAGSRTQEAFEAFSRAEVMDVG